ncbi:hypothetical protein [Haloplasma contractile]|uniref:Uncharacterized protein n=1 Tax=Haloplasma contractile SSD-17B TaxID=1033810 RepID=F7PW32_9MOLU|nr:hypothetical protein [Haloplasma contractile]ERJ12642.1 hypothetical protein HLPCO_000982 [Haloplasma contractile SSD-17B]
MKKRVAIITILISFFIGVFYLNGINVRAAFDDVTYEEVDID